MAKDLFPVGGSARIATESIRRHKKERKVERREDEQSALRAIKQMADLDPAGAADSWNRQFGEKYGTVNYRGSSRGFKYFQHDPTKNIMAITPDGNLVTAKKGEGDGLKITAATRQKMIGKGLPLTQGGLITHTRQELGTEVEKATQKRMSEYRKRLGDVQKKDEAISEIRQDFPNVFRFEVPKPSEHLGREQYPGQGTYSDVGEVSTEPNLELLETVIRGEEAFRRGLRGEQFVRGKAAPTTGREKAAGAITAPKAPSVARQRLEAEVQGKLDWMKREFPELFKVE